MQKKVTFISSRRNDHFGSARGSNPCHGRYKKRVAFTTLTRNCSFWPISTGNCNSVWEVYKLFYLHRFRTGLSSIFWRVCTIKLRNEHFRWEVRRFLGNVEFSTHIYRSNCDFGGHLRTPKWSIFTHFWRETCNLDCICTTQNSLLENAKKHT